MSLINNMRVDSIKKLLLVLGSNSDLPSFRYSQLDRGIVEACKTLGTKTAADMALACGVSIKSAVKLIQIASRS